MSSNLTEIISGAHTLNKLMPNLASEERVGVSARHAERVGDHGAMSNSERKVGSHLLRLEELLSREGVEKRVWESATKELVISEYDIPEAYWDQQRQLARDDGHGDVIINSRMKAELTKQLQDAQLTGLNSWREYLEQSGEQYPVWFKLYAWDGMSHLGIFDKDKGIYRKRSGGTVAPYPQLNPAALASVYEMVQGGIENGKASSSVSGNFNKMYSSMLMEQKASIPTPEKPEDVHGEWRMYTGDQIKEITQAAQGTPWCIAGERMARHYTEDGGEFMLFHLKESETGVISPTACASIRLDRDGRVVELSGLNGGSSQFLEDSLVPTVEEKVKTLPGGERYLEAFGDRQKLIEMDKKFKAGDRFTEEEILFLYEIERPILYVDTYAKDPRPEQFKVDSKSHFDTLSVKYGEDGARTVLLSRDEIEKHFLDYLRDEKYDPAIIANRVSPKMRARHIIEFQEAGANIDADELVKQLQFGDILDFCEQLVQAGANLSPDELAAKSTWDLRFKAGHLLRVGANPSVLMEALTKIRSELSDYDLGSLAQVFVHNGVPSEVFLSLVEESGLHIKDLTYESKYIQRSAEQLLEAGVNPDAVARHTYPTYLEEEYMLDQFLDKGASPTAVMDGLGSYSTTRAMKKLMERGADIQDVVHHIEVEPKYLFEHVDELNGYGANLSTEEVASRMEPEEIIRHISEIAEKNIKLDINAILDQAKPGDVPYYRVQELIDYGADPAKIADKMSTWDFNRDSSAYRYSWGRIEAFPEIKERIENRIANEHTASYS